mmetsp:Transcript_15963/g.38657  ORF Transcript_15963/g.38657 Transcript_15963/m.38657 type:complete len:262 (+) Transcript_15963:2129-2914(+)
MSLLQLLFAMIGFLPATLFGGSACQHATRQGPTAPQCLLRRYDQRLCGAAGECHQQPFSEIQSQWLACPRSSPPAAHSGSTRVSCGGPTTQQPHTAAGANLSTYRLSLLGLPVPAVPHRFQQPSLRPGVLAPPPRTQLPQRRDCSRSRSDPQHLRDAQTGTTSSQIPSRLLQSAACHLFRVHPCLSPCREPIEQGLAAVSPGAAPCPAAPMHLRLLQGAGLKPVSPQGPPWTASGLYPSQTALLLLSPRSDGGPRPAGPQR